MKQLIYRRDATVGFPDCGVSGTGFRYCRCPRDLVPVQDVLSREFGVLGLLKAKLKLLSDRRAFYLIVAEGQLLHYGWISFGFCNYYHIGKDSADIGPIWTAESARGRGLATVALKGAINAILERGCRSVYMDTSEDNIACLKVIWRCGFDILAGTYIRESNQRPGAAGRSWIKRCLPSWLLRGFHNLVGADAINRARWNREHANVLSRALRVPVRADLPRLGIVKDVMMRHSYYEAACLELGVPYDLVDITGPDWVDAVRRTDCAAYLVRPYVLTSSGKRLYDDRVRIMADEMGKRIFPSVKSLWLYESKRRGAGWLEANGVPHPKTWCFNDRGAALAFGATCTLPVLFKTDLGSEATGVRLLRRRADLLALVKRCFSKGVAAAGYDVSGNVTGELLLQEFIPDAREWRMVRIGNSYFGHRKGKAGDFHSGSKIIEFDTPPEALLRFVKDVTDKGPFENMSLDILETPNGDYLVIELHCYFGCNSPHVMRIGSEPGRYRYNHDSDSWTFEPGDFNRNASCNLRIATLLECISRKG